MVGYRVAWFVYVGESWFERIIFHWRVFPPTPPNSSFYPKAKANGVGRKSRYTNGQKELLFSSFFFIRTEQNISLAYKQEVEGCCVSTNQNADDNNYIQPITTPDRLGGNWLSLRMVEGRAYRIGLISNGLSVKIPKLDIKVLRDLSPFTAVCLTLLDSQPLL